MFLIYQDLAFKKRKGGDQYLKMRALLNASLLNTRLNAGKGGRDTALKNNPHVCEEIVFTENRLQYILFMVFPSPRSFQLLPTSSATQFPHPFSLMVSAYLSFHFEEPQRSEVNYSKAEACVKASQRS